jgi:hypothetical protein
MLSGFPAAGLTQAIMIRAIDAPSHKINRLRIEVAPEKASA